MPDKSSKPPLDERHLSAVTKLIHHDYQPPAGFVAPMPGIYKASTVIFPTTAALRARNWKEKTGYTYGLHGTPTSFILEERLATLEGGLRTLLVPSGLAAIALVNAAFLRAGDEVLLPDNVYGPSKELARNELAHWGITHRVYDPQSADDLRSKIGSATKLVWLEAAGSVTMEFPDLLGLVRVCREKGVLSALDNTWGAGVAFNAFDLQPGDGTSETAEALGVDISMHALTKYPSGGGDVLMGSVTTRDKALHEALAGAHMRIGFGVAGNDVELVLRSLPSLALRYAAHDASARKAAEWFGTRSEVVQVMHPAIEGSPGHAYWKQVTSQAAGLFSVVFDPKFSAARVDTFIDALKIFKIGYSWGGPISLVVPYQIANLRSLPFMPKGIVVRFAVGLCDTDDLIADLASALEVLAGDSQG
ncbi:PLP-dependent transferase [soil metagenome]